MILWPSSLITHTNTNIKHQLDVADQTDTALSAIQRLISKVADLLQFVHKKVKLKAHITTPLAFETWRRAYNRRLQWFNNVRPRAFIKWHDHNWTALLENLVVMQKTMLVDCSTNDQQRTLFAECLTSKCERWAAYAHIRTIHVHISIYICIYICIYIHIYIYIHMIHIRSYMGHVSAYTAHARARTDHLGTCGPCMNVLAQHKLWSMYEHTRLTDASTSKPWPHSASSKRVYILTPKSNDKGHD